MTETKIREFRKLIFSWWKKHKRDLPWRHTRNPYKILVSEIMLQQTQVDRVIPKYSEFIQKYPTIYSLARSPIADIIRSWKGLGYNRRSIYLHKTAQEIVLKYYGVFPKDEHILRSLPGIGPYTSRAIMIFSYNADVAAVDINIRKILTHYFFRGIVQKESVIQQTAQHILPQGKSWQWHQALMDYGALELPKLNMKNMIRKNRIPFKNTDRYVRGRIIDLLRECDWQEDQFIGEIVSRYKIDALRIRDNLSRLVTEHMIKISGTTISLP